MFRGLQAKTWLTVTYADSAVEGGAKVELATIVHVADTPKAKTPKKKKTTQLEAQEWIAGVCSCRLSR